MASSSGMLTIGQLADFARVTIKAIRHYHERGLLAEPPRDASGYRRYSVEHAIAVVKIKKFADAGVPLARIEELLAADPAGFAATIAELDRDLERRIAELANKRERIAQLHAGDRLFVSPEVADFLDDLRELGVSARVVRAERDVWILLQSKAPSEAAIWISEKRAAFADPAFRALYLEYDRAFAWSPHDARLAALAERTRQWFASRPTPTKSTPPPAAVRQLIAMRGISPAWDRLGTM